MTTKDNHITEIRISQLDTTESLGYSAKHVLRTKKGGFYFSHVEQDSEKNHVLVLQHFTPEGVMDWEMAYPVDTYLSARIGTQIRMASDEQGNAHILITCEEKKTSRVRAMLLHYTKVTPAGVVVFNTVEKDLDRLYTNNPRPMEDPVACGRNYVFDHRVSDNGKALFLCEYNQQGEWVAKRSYTDITHTTQAGVVQWDGVAYLWKLIVLADKSVFVVSALRSDLTEEKSSSHDLPFRQYGEGEFMSLPLIVKSCFNGFLLVYQLRLPTGVVCSYVRRINYAGRLLWERQIFVDRRAYLTDKAYVTLRNDMLCIACEGEEHNVLYVSMLYIDAGDMVDEKRITRDSAENLTVLDVNMDFITLLVQWSEWIMVDRPTSKKIPKAQTKKRLRHTSTVDILMTFSGEENGFTVTRFVQP